MLSASSWRASSASNPRQRCRGPVEARVARRKFASGSPILGSDAEAPLKLRRPPWGGPPGASNPRQRCRGPVEASRTKRPAARRTGPILGSDAEAPLKPALKRRCFERPAPKAILGSDAEAPLKRAAALGLRAWSAPDPRQRCRGPVEAASPASPVPGHARCDPRQRCRGPVEACRVALDQHAAIARPILGSDAEAPLKPVLRRHSRDPRCERSSAAMPRPR